MAPKKAPAVRDAALDVLLRWESKAQPVDALLGQACAVLPDERDHFLLKSLVYGVLQQRTLLDHTLAPFVRQPPGRLKKVVLLSLRLGLYQILFLDRIPPPIAVHETVAALRRRGQPRQLIGFANAVLRNILREREKGGWQPWRDAPLYVRCSHPAWMVERWERRFGRPITEQVCAFNNTPPPLVLRVNTTVISRAAYLALLQREGIGGEEGLFAPEAVYVKDHRGGPERLPGFGQGYFQVQDEGAQLISHLLGPFVDGLYIDCCSGLGGKTSHLRQLLPQSGHLEAIEPHAGRRRLFRENMTRLGMSVPLFEGTLQQYSQKEGFPKAAGVLLDAPCSGLGVIRRHPEIRWNRTEKGLAIYQQQQLALLFLASDLLQPGGRLVYATCSTEPEENETVVDQFLSGHPDFVPGNCVEVLPESAAILVDHHGFFRTIPGRHGLDGFFGALLVKPAS